MSKAIQDAYRKIGDWWGETLPDVDDDCAAYVIGISLGLSTLFGDNKEAELQWLDTAKPFRTPMDLIKTGKRSRILLVVAQLDEARNLR